MKKKKPVRQNIPTHQSPDSKKNLEPDVHTKIHKLRGHFSSIHFEPGPPPEVPDFLKKKSSEDKDTHKA